MLASQVEKLCYDIHEHSRPTTVAKQVVIVVLKCLLTFHPIQIKQSLITRIGREWISVTISAKSS